MKRKICCTMLIGLAMLGMVACSKDEMSSDIDYGVGTNSQNVEIPATTLEAIDEAKFVAMKENDDFKYVVFDNHIEIIEYIGIDKTVEIPAEIDGLFVRRISGLFRLDESDITDIVIPESVISIKESELYVFNKNATNIEIPSSVVELDANSLFKTTWYNNIDEEYCMVGDGILIKCSLMDANATSIKYPDGVKKMYALTWQNLGIPSKNKDDESANKLREIIIPEGCEEIEVFYALATVADGKKIENIVIPNSVKRISRKCFESTKWLDDFKDEFVIVGDGVLIDTNLPEEISECVIPNEVKYIACDLDFASYMDVRIIFPSNLQGIDWSCIGTFGEIAIMSGENTSKSYIAKDWELEENKLIITNDYKEIDESLIAAFSEEELFKDVTISEGVETIGSNAFGSCYLLEKISIPSTCSVIREGAFSGCLELQEVILAEGVTYIGDYAFYRCDLQSIIIPESVTYIGKNAFASNVYEDSNNYKNYTIENYPVVIRGVSGSYAESYAYANGFTFRPIN